MASVALGRFGDVVKLLLGLAYREGGYTLGLKVADELHLTVPWVMT
jgi:hypothetical protein